jgi:hypothetical protein
VIINIFYSWQSDLELTSHKYFIEKILNNAISNLSTKSSIVAVVDRDTKGNTGSPDIFDTIIKKIDKSRIFVCDLSIVSSPDMPNPNVLIELGYAIKTLGWDRIICLFDKDSGNIEDLPFNINHNRITPYKYDKSGNDVTRISKIISDTVTQLHSNGSLFDPVEDYVKGKIDYVLLEILKNIDTVYFSSTLKKGELHKITDLLDFSKDDLKVKLTGNSFLGFYFVQSYENRIEALESLLDRLFLTNSFDDKAKAIIVKLIRWIESWNDLVSQRFHKNLFIKQKDSDYKVVDMHKENSANPSDSCILVKPVDKTSHQVIRGGVIKKYNYQIATSYLSINEKHVDSVSRIIHHFIEIFDEWMDISGNEFILDPKYYKL